MCNFERTIFQLNNGLEIKIFKIKGNSLSGAEEYSLLAKSKILNKLVSGDDASEGNTPSHTEQDG